MNEDFQDDSSGTVHVTQRSPTFNREEAEALISLVEDYKNIILNKSTNSVTNHAKELVWIKIAKTFNSKGFKNVRPPESLKTKWENLKRDAKKLSKNLLSCDLSEKQFLNKVIILLNESDNFGPIDPGEVEPEDYVIENKKRRLWEDDEDGTSSHSQADGGNLSRKKFRVQRSLNFSPQECNLLLKCIKSEKDHIFMKDLTSRSTKMKRNAWAKVTYIYNKLSPQKRSMKTLRTKFDNMRKRAQQNGRNGIKHEKLLEESDVKVKSEPLFEYTFEKESSPELSDDDHNIIEEQRGNDDYSDPVRDLGSPDPLTTILNGDSGIDSINNFTFSQPEDKEITKLKLEVLKNQLETSKIEKQRMQEKVELDRKEKEARALEMSLRLRTARLELIAAEAKLPSNHPALEYQHNELKAREYMQQFTNT